MAQQTAVEWLVEQYANENYGIEVYEQAKQMEREQIINAHNSGVVTPYTNLYTIPTQVQGKELITKGEQYYNETYGK